MSGEWHEGLTRKQRMFVEAYVGEAAGNATEAARLAGYASPDGSASDNMGKPKIMRAIGALDQQLAERSDALTVDEINEWWALLARDPGLSPRDRLTALRDAARARGMFVDRVEHSGAVGVGVQIYLPSNGREAGEEE